MYPSYPLGNWRCRIVQHLTNDKLAELCRKGFKYRIVNKKVSWNMDLKVIGNALTNCKTKQAYNRTLRF